MKTTSTITHTNGGFEQGILQAVNQDGLLSEADKLRLAELQSLPQNRTELLGKPAELRQAIPGDQVTKGMILHNPQMEKGYSHGGKHYYPSKVVMKLTKYKIMFEDYSTVNKFDKQGKPYTYTLAD